MRLCKQAKLRFSTTVQYTKLLSEYDVFTYILLNCLFLYRTIIFIKQFQKHTQEKSTFVK